MSNYQAWEVNVDDFPKNGAPKEKLQFLVRFAVLAPSSHNSQPWKFSVSEKEIQVKPDFNRALPKSDVNHRQLYISLGCALENMLIAADYYGFRVSVQYFLSEDVAAVVSFEVGEGQAQKKDHPVFAIPKRHSNRNKYDSKLPPSDFLSWVKSLETESTKIELVTERGVIQRVARVVTDANVSAMDSDDFREELSHYVKPNTTSSSLGMPMFGFGMPTILSFLAPALLKRFNVNKASRKQDEALLSRYSPALVVISTKGDSKEDWVRVGQLYSKISIEAENRGVRTAPMAAVVQIGEFYKDLQRVLSLAFRPQFFFRMGYCEKIPHHAPRLSAEEVIED